MSKSLPRKIYQFLVVPANVRLDFPLAICNITEYSAENAFEIAKKNQPGKNLILIGYKEASLFFNCLNYDLTLKPDAHEEKIIPKILKEVNYADKTQEEIARLCEYLRDNGYSVFKKSKKSKHESPKDEGSARP